MSPEDRIRILHMIEAAQEAIGFIGNRTIAELEQDRKTLFAVIRCVEIIGEAAARRSQATRSAAPDIPWNAIIGMRNRLVHAYFDVDTHVVWKTVTVELPALNRRLQALL
ncbi:MAG: DUF86 domain-containing protein [Rhodocyclaceae bacterium]|nr:DUF86 domain-containing protein [Rhodocyclaceae bacterium]